jgi:hypothetical protein
MMPFFNLPDTSHATAAPCQISSSGCVPENLTSMEGIGILTKQALRTELVGLAGNMTAAL